MASYRVNFVDEDDAGGILLALFEQIANPAGAHAHEHFYEVRTGDRKERNVRFAGNRPSQKGFAGPRRANQQYAFGNSAAKFLELLRFAKKFDNFSQLFLSLFHSSHVLKRDFLLLHREQPGAALSE